MRRILVLISASALLEIVWSATPKISFISGPEVVKDLGDTAELECRVDNGKEYPINWMKIREERGMSRESLPLSTGRTLAVKDDRIEILYDSARLGYTLKISNLEASDAAKYMCQVRIGIDDKVFREVSLQVRIPPEIQRNQTEELTVTENESFSLYCPVTGFPQPRVEWRRDDGQLIPEASSQTFVGETLRIATVRKEDRGKYTCTADNKVGEPVSENFQLQVQFKPSIRVPTPRIHQALRHSITLACDIEAYPTPGIQWSKDGKPVFNDNKHTVVHFSRNPTLVATTVQIYRVDSENYGTYECHATNVHGTAVQKLELIQTDMPIPEAAYGGGNKITGAAIVFFCIVVGLHNLL